MARVMMWHVDYFRAVPRENGRSEVVEPSKAVDVDNALVVFISFEKQDSGRESEVVEKSYEQISTLSAQLGVKTVVLNPFAHLFGDLAKPDDAAKLLSMLGERLRSAAFDVHSLSFGLFYEIELRAKGHKLSRVSRIV